MTEVVEIGKSEALHLISSGKCGLIEDQELKRRVDQHAAVSERFVGFFAGNTLLGILGAYRPYAISNEGYVWLNHAPAISSHRIGFLRAARPAADLMFQYFDDLFGVCYETRSMLWLRWIGADFGPLGADGGWPFVLWRPGHD